MTLHKLVIRVPRGPNGGEWHKDIPETATPGLDFHLLSDNGTSFDILVTAHDDPDLVTGGRHLTAAAFGAAVARLNPSNGITILSPLDARAVGFAAYKNPAKAKAESS